MLEKLDIVLNPTSIQAAPIQSVGTSQAARSRINQVYSGGLTLANLNPQPAITARQQSGAGFRRLRHLHRHRSVQPQRQRRGADHISMSHLNNGAEEIFLSGTYAPTDIVPEPGSLVLCAMGCIVWRCGTPQTVAQFVYADTNALQFADSATRVDPNEFVVCD